MSLSWTDLSAGLGELPAFRGWSGAVNHGEVVVVLGANGVGKTTLLRTIIGASRLFAGRVELDGKSLDDRTSTSQRYGMGLAYVPERAGIFGRLTVTENIRLGAGGLGRTELRKRLDGIWQSFPLLVPLANRPAGYLSGGEKQALAIARGLVAAPSYLLLDEPTLGLAPILVDGMVSLISTIRSSTSVLIAEQNVRFGLAVADRCYMASALGELRPLDPKDPAASAALVSGFLGTE